MKKTLANFTEIIALYVTVDGEPGTPEYTQSLERLRTKYLSFKQQRLGRMLKDLKEVRMITGQKMDIAAHPIRPCSLDWLLLKIHKFFRYLFILYYYIMPFLILVFQTMLLYSGEIYTNYKKRKVDE